MINRIPQKSLFLLYMILIISVSLMPSSVIKIGYLWKYDKIIHFIEYLILGFLLLNCFSPNNYVVKILVLVFICLTIFSGIDEFIIQKFFTNTRIPDINDWLMDIFGSFFGVVIRYLIGYKVK